MKKNLKFLAMAGVAMADSNPRDKFYQCAYQF